MAHPDSLRLDAEEALTGEAAVVAVEVATDVGKTGTPIVLCQVQLRKPGTSIDYDNDEPGVTDGWFPQMIHWVMHKSFLFLRFENRILSSTLAL